MTQETAPFTMYAYLSGSWVDITVDVRQENQIKLSWGIRGNRQVDRLADAGSMAFTLDNHTGKYSPDGPSALAGWGMGIPVLLIFTYDGEPYDRFYGTVKTINIKFTKSTNERVADVTVLDWMDYASKYPVVSPQALADVRANQALNTILSAMPIQPQGVNFASGLEILPAVFDSTTIDTRAYTEFSKLVKSESGYLYIRKDKNTGGTLTFEANDTRNGLRPLKTIPLVSADSGFMLLETGDHLLLETGDKIILNQSQDASITDDITGMDLKYGDSITNRFTVRAFPKRLDIEDTVLYSLPSPMPIATGETITFRAQYTDPSGGNRVNASNGTMITPVVNGTSDLYLASLLHFNGADVSTTFTDETGKTWTAHNGAIIINSAAAISKLGGGCGQFGGANEYIDTPSHVDFEFGNGDFNVEWYAYIRDPIAGDCTMARDGLSTYPAWAFGLSDGVDLGIYLTSTGTSWDAMYPRSLGKISQNTWVHYAISRDGNVFRTFRDGQLVDTWIDPITIVASTGSPSVGRFQNTKYQFVNMDEWRTLKRCEYKSNFTPPAVQFTGLLDGDYLANTADDGSGTDLTSNIVISAVYGSEAVVYTVQNTSASQGFITRLRARGRGIYQYNPAEISLSDSASIAIHGYENDAIEQQYQNNLIAGKREAEKYIDIGKKPRTDLKAFSILANVSHYHMMLALNLDIGDLVYLSDTNTGVGGRYYIQSVGLTRGPGGIIAASFGVKQAWSLSNGLTAMAADINTTGTTGALEFGNVPQAANLRYLTASAWIYATDASASIIGNYSDYSGWLLLATGGNALRFIQFGTGDRGGWNTTQTFTFDAWHFVTVTRDTLLPGTKPIIYIDGVAATVTETDTQLGGLKNDALCSVQVGNVSTVSQNYTSPFIGKIKDARIYNRILTQAEITAMNTAGAYDMSNTSGMIFQAPLVRTKELTYWTDHTMLSGDRMIDNVYSVVGTPNGNVITRTI